MPNGNGFPFRSNILNISSYLYRWTNIILRGKIEETKQNDAGTLGNGIELVVESIGLTYLGAEIPSFTFRRTSEEKQPAVGIDCGIHSNEWISPAMCRMLVNELIRCSNPQTSTTCDDFFVEQFYDFDWYIIPMVNPDGYNYTWDSW